MLARRSYAREKELLLDPRLFVDALQRGENFPTACESTWRSSEVESGRSSPVSEETSGSIKRGPARRPPV